MQAILCTKASLIGSHACPTLVEQQAHTLCSLSKYAGTVETVGLNIAAAVDPDAVGQPDYSDMATVADKNTETLISSHGMAEPNSQEAVRIFPEA